LFQIVENELKRWNIDNVDTHVIGGGKYKKVSLMFLEVYVNLYHLNNF